ncbi:hypothetical protein [Pseudomonas chlororaphis]|uniref:hypothetical protein n=1 Tax=Pseudomonas chlororaphis TaxID=587753 RepID=UPI0006A5A190|nr:hypothetical protein [Pseudomonas chlororaphis]AZD00106.1 hypothetical protein C4K27_0893 [Pseudomonas chlororaphis subsp. chlororaphis]MBM0281912.1 hypothetical protein [Pseudomonas chlororaphis]MDO1504305.1 hypothetical protein [Pseudomonas chlororaphis]ORM49352.1 hypothetical protein B6D51_07760 [Pseudomonas chlororaphis subsp. chlororaphis]TWR94543.1 hypothetical protein FJD36_15930 [Pseudomonas chlororaphis subsp. chlororaphis]
MRKTFPLQVWQTARLILGIPLSHATRNLHSDNFTASHNINAADDVLCIRHRLQGPGHPFSTASLTKPSYFIRSTQCAKHLRQAGMDRRLNQKPVDTCPIDAPSGGTTRSGCPVRRQPMHQKKPAHTVKCANIYTNASFLYVRSTP